MFEVSHAGADSHIYEERVTIWQAADEDRAFALAEAEAVEYASTLAVTYLGLAQLYALTDEPGHGAEIFSLMRDSDASPEDYLSTHFNTGRERQRTSD